MGYDYMELIENYNNYQWASTRFHDNEEEANKEIEYIASRLKEKFRSGIKITSDEIAVLFNYEVFPYETQDGEYFDHGYIWRDYIFEIEDNETYMMTFAYHDDRGIADNEAQVAIKCEHKPVTKFMWVPVEED